jgi:hypothetical protein
MPELGMKTNGTQLLFPPFLSNGAAQAQDAPADAKSDVWLRGKS